MYYFHTSINIHERVCTMYLPIYEIMNMHQCINEIMYMYVHPTYNLYIFMVMYIHLHTRSWFYETVWTCTTYMSVSCSDTGTPAYAPFCPFLSRWSGFQMYYYTFPVPVRTGTYQYVPLQYVTVLNTLFLYNQSESRFQMTVLGPSLAWSSWKSRY